MKAIIQRKYGDPDGVLDFQDVSCPAPADDQVLVRVHATSVHADVWHVLTGRPYILRMMGAGMMRPKNNIPGTDMAGVVETVGKNVQQFKVGDAVFGETVNGFQWVNGGTFAEYVACDENALEHIPAGVSFEQAAATLTPAIIALNNLQVQRPIQAGQHILINGAGGCVGSVALQLAKIYGATVTAVDHTGKLSMLRDLGADHTIDYTTQDITQGTQHYDLIFDVASNLVFTKCKRILTPTGLYVMIGHDHYGTAGRAILGAIPQFLKLALRTPFDKHLPKLSFAKPDQKANLREIARLLATGQLKSVIHKSFPLAEVLDAMRLLQSGTSQGRILLIP